MAQIGFRPTTISDEPDILALLEEALGLRAGDPMVERKHLHWKYWEPREDWNGSRSYVLTKDEQIVAHGAVVPCLCTWGTQRITMVQVIDWAAKAASRGSGGVLMQKIGGLANAIITASGSDMAIPVLPFIGFKPSGTIVTHYFRPIRPLVSLMAAQKFDWRSWARFVRDSLRIARVGSGEVGSWSARLITADQLAAEPIPWPIPKFGTAVFERTPAVMSYLLRCPAAPMELYGVEENGIMHGYFVLAFAPDKTRLAECWLDSKDHSDWRAMVNLAIRRAHHGGAAELVALSSEPLLSDALEKSGFRVSCTRPLFLRDSGETRLPDSGIRIQMLDNDAAYLHNGFNRS